MIEAGHIRTLVTCSYWQSVTPTTSHRISIQIRIHERCTLCVRIHCHSQRYTLCQLLHQPSLQSCQVQVVNYAPRGMSLLETSNYRNHSHQFSSYRCLLTGLIIQLSCESRGKVASAFIYNSVRHCYKMTNLSIIDSLFTSVFTLF